MTDARAILKEWAEGLESVTPGEWSVDGFNLSGVIARAPGKTHVSDWRHLAICQSENANWRADAAHIARCSPDRIAAVLAHVEALEKALEPFALVAELDIGMDEADADVFKPISEPRNALAPRLTVGDLRRARKLIGDRRR